MFAIIAGTVAAAVSHAPSTGATEGCWREDQSTSTRQKSIPAIRRMRGLPSTKRRNSAVSGIHSRSIVTLLVGPAPTGH